MTCNIENYDNLQQNGPGAYLYNLAISLNKSTDSTIIQLSNLCLHRCAKLGG